VRSVGFVALLLASSASAEPDKAKPSSIVDDASGLANLLAGGEPATPRALDRTLPAPSNVGVHVGHDDVGFRGDVALHATVYAGLPLALAALRGTSVQHHDDDLPHPMLGPQPQAPGGKLKLDRREMRELSRCYRKALAFDPATSAHVDLSFSIDKKGRVLAPMAVSDSSELDACLDGVMARWKFPGKGGKDRIWLGVVLAPR